ncbi:MAG: DUF2905 domain-containing protein [Nitrospirota bacterium]|nr:DUF2905 domain-containing protein [Nitrospirota bacterium]NOY83775.1 DUF2905 domain-containing protein [Candidatus Manganitrophaceae bacterium]
MFNLGRTLVSIGFLLLVIGGLLMLLNKVPGVGKLPGDILIERKNFTFYFPLATSIIVSLLLSLLFWFIGKR